MKTVVACGDELVENGGQGSAGHAWLGILKYLSALSFKCVGYLPVEQGQPMPSPIDEGCQQPFVPLNRLSCCKSLQLLREPSAGIGQSLCIMMQAQDQPAD